MARIRSIKPEFWTSEQVMECSPIARLLFVGLWNFADDCGRISLSAKTMKAQIFPGDDIAVDSILRMVQELSVNGLVLPYSVDGKDYLQITGWQHQRIDKPQPAKHPPPRDGYSKNIPGMVATDRKGEEGKGEEGKGEEKISEANASAPSAPVYTDAKHELWGEGPTTLTLLGVATQQARKMIGQWLKVTDDDANSVLSAIQRARDHRPVDPIPWITQALKASNERPRFNSASQQSNSAAVIAGVAAATERRDRQRVATGQKRTTAGLLDFAGRSDPAA